MIFYCGFDTEPKHISGFSVVPGDGCAVFPGFCDVHVHLREPGFSYKETVADGTAAAARGGYTDLLTMPNLNPVPDSLQNLELQKRIIKETALVRVKPFASVTVGEKGKELSPISGLAPHAAGFSDDGKGVQSEALMRRAMTEVAASGSVLAAHCEDDRIRGNGCIHDGKYARAHSLAGIPSESEWRQVERDLRLAKETGCRYHVCHVSCEESVNLIRQAKAEGVDVTCETAPHYLVLTEDDLRDEGRFKMNPPLRTARDRDALIRGINDGTVDIIATDHAPHSEEEKSGGLAGSLMGITGLETAFPVMYTRLVLTGLIPLETLVRCLTSAPRKRFSLPQPEDDFSVWDLNSEYTVNPAEFLSKGKSTPFAGMTVRGKCILTVCGGKTVWKA